MKIEHWFLANIANPYPNTEMKFRMANELGIEVIQVEDKLANLRQRRGHGAHLKYKKSLRSFKRSDFALH